MLRILSLSSRYPNVLQPGAGKFVEDQLRALAERAEIEVEVVSPIAVPPFPLSLRPRHRRWEELPDEEVRVGLRVHRPRYAAIPFRPAHRARAMASALLPVLRAIRERFAFDMVHAEFFWPEGPAAQRLAEALDLPYSIKARGGDFDIPSRHRARRRLVREAGQGAAVLLAVSESLRRAMIGFGLPPGRIAVHRTGIDRSLFRPGDRAAAKAALKVQGPLLLNVGNLIPRKRQALAIEALRLVEEATLILIGAGPDHGALEELVRRLGLGRRIRLVGRVPHALLPAFYRAADVTIHTAAAEGLANVWIESLACGTPVVTTGTAAAGEVIDRPDAGRIVPPEASAIAEATREMLALAPAPASVATAVDRFSWDRNAAELEAHLRLAAQTRPAGSGSPVMAGG